jgi:hypothetical protein
MHTKTILSLLMPAALVASTVVLAHAGGGGLGGPGGSTFFQCYAALQGPDAPHAVEVNDQFIDPTAQRIGKLKLVCTFPTVSPALNPEVAGTDINAVQPPFDVTCYEASGGNASAVVSYTDSLFNQPQMVKVQGPARYICVLANTTCLSGCPPPTGP